MSTSPRQDLGLLALRVGVGSTLVAHGTQKLFGWFGGHGLEGTAGGMAAMGFHPPKQSALAAGLGEAGGGKEVRCATSGWFGGHQAVRLKFSQPGVDRSRAG